MPALLTEFGATDDLANIASVMQIADKYRTGWLEWAYTGHDKTSSSPDGQALVLDPEPAARRRNVVTDKLRTLAEPYPQLVAGTPAAVVVLRRRLPAELLRRRGSTGPGRSRPAP